MPKIKAKKIKQESDNTDLSEAYDLIIRALTGKYKNADPNQLYYELDDDIVDILNAMDNTEIVNLAEYAYNREFKEDIDLYVDTLLNNVEFAVDDIALLIEDLPSPLTMAFNYGYSILYSTIKYRVIKNINPAFLKTNISKTQSRNGNIS